ncbi:MAG: MFS transporter, partial [Marmoricola sp.]
MARDASPGATASGGTRLLVACLLGGSAGWAITAVGAGARTVAEAYGTDLLWVGLLSAALAAPYAALQFPAGTLVDRLGVRRSTAAGLSLVLLAHLLALVAPVPSLALAARFASGVGFAVCFVSGAELARASGRGARGMGVFGGVALAASGASVLGVTLAEPALGWRAPWATSAVVSAVALAATLWLPDPRASRSPSPSGGTRAAAPSSLLRDGQLFRLAALHAATLGLGLVLSTWATTLLVDVWAFAPAAAAVVGSLVL